MGRWTRVARVGLLQALVWIVASGMVLGLGLVLSIWTRGIVCLI